MCGVVLEVVADLVLAGEGPLLRRERQPGQAVVLRGGVELERVPLAAPVVADPGAGVEDHERATPALQVVAGREPGLAGADDDGLDVVVSMPATLGLRCLIRVGRTTHSCTGARWVDPPTPHVQSRPVASSNSLVRLPTTMIDLACRP